MGDKRASARVQLDSSSEEGLGHSHGNETGDINYVPDEYTPTTKLFSLNYVMVLLGFGMAFVGSQLQPLLFAAIIPVVSAEFHASNLLVWLFCTQQIATGVIAPFAGSLSDLFGRKKITIAGVISSMLGMIVSAATPTAAGYLAGQVFNGIGIAIQELMAIAAIAEIVPTKYRGYHIAIVVASFLPFAPASLYGALIAERNWRYCAALIAIWNAITAVILGLFYHPPPRHNTQGLWEKVKKIDILGGVIMTIGLVLLLVALNLGGQSEPWSSTRVICCLTFGIALLISFFVYEVFAPSPMFPRSLLRHPRTFSALMVVILLAGINYVSLLVFWVLEAVSVYNSNQVELGIRTLPYGFCIMGGAIMSAILISLFKGYLRSIMTAFCIVQVIGNPPPLYGMPFHHLTDE